MLYLVIPERYLFVSPIKDILYTAASHLYVLEDQKEQISDVLMDDNISSGDMIHFGRAANIIQNNYNNWTNTLRNITDIMDYKKIELPKHYCCEIRKRVDILNKLDDFKEYLEYESESIMRVNKKLCIFSQGTPYECYCEYIDYDELWKSNVIQDNTNTEITFVPITTLN